MKVTLDGKTRPRLRDYPDDGAYIDALHRWIDQLEKIVGENLIGDFMEANRSVSMERALRAIKARIEGDFDNENLTAFGPLDARPTNDLLRIVESTLAEE